jgi:hypothetical protein
MPPPSPTQYKRGSKGLRPFVGWVREGQRPSRLPATVSPDLAA